MKNKMKKIIGMIVLVLLIITPLVSAVPIQDFLMDMENNPSNYYIWHDRSEPEMVAKIQDLADAFGVQVTNTKLPGRDFVIIVGQDSAFGSDYVTELTNPYVITEVDGTQQYLSIFFVGGVADAYLEGLSENLNVILDYLLTYKSWPIDKYVVKVYDYQVVEQQTPSCAEFDDNDHDVWHRDESIYNGRVLRDRCNYDTLYELTCVNNYMKYVQSVCPRGCADGRCINTPFILVDEYVNSTMTSGDFDWSMSRWIDA